MAVALALCASLLLTCSVEVWRQPVETEADVQKAGGLPVLGAVGVIQSRGPAKRKRHEGSLPVHIAFTASNPDIHTDLYRAIRAGVETEALKGPFRSILVSSPGPAEGKSTTVLNLAHVFQEFGRRVLVIDADLRRPSLHRALGFTNKPGLVDYLTGSATFDEITRPLPSGVVVIPGQFTRQDAGSLLASPRLKELLTRTREQFDLVLVDSAPLLAVPDNLLLITQVERVILVARASHTSKRDLERAQQLIQQASTKVLGVILNQAQRHDIPYFRSRYRRYYRVPEPKPATEPRLALPAGRR
jgi:capsular exopolysaccharide synthesis family protein